MRLRSLEVTAGKKWDPFSIISAKNTSIDFPTELYPWLSHVPISELRLG